MDLFSSVSVGTVFESYGISVCGTDEFVTKADQASWEEFSQCCWCFWSLCSAWAVWFKHHSITRLPNAVFELSSCEGRRSSPESVLPRGAR